jgi:hypothetical protein
MTPRTEDGAGQGHRLARPMARIAAGGLTGGAGPVWAGQLLGTQRHHASFLALRNGTPPMPILVLERSLAARPPPPPSPPPSPPQRAGRGGRPPGGCRGARCRRSRARRTLGGGGGEGGAVGPALTAARGAGGVGGRAGPAARLAMHPLRLLVAAGAGDSVVSLYHSSFVPAT